MMLTMAYRATLERDKEVISYRSTPDGSNETPKPRSAQAGMRSARKGAEPVREKSTPARGGEKSVQERKKLIQREAKAVQERGEPVQEGGELVREGAKSAREEARSIREGAGSAREGEQPVPPPLEQSQEGQERNYGFKKQKRPWSPYKKYHLPQVIKSSYNFELLADNKGTYAPARALTTPDSLSDLQRRILQIVMKSWKTAHEEHKDEIVARFGLPEKVRRWDRWDYGPTFSELINELGIRDFFPTRYLCSRELYKILRWMRLWGLIEGVGDKNKPRNLRPGPRITGELIDITEWRKRPRDTEQEEMQPPRETSVEQA
jgi:hypothetical protein